jgi:hypothetical protein
MTASTFHAALRCTALAATALLAACGGGGGDTASTDTSVSAATAESAGANGMVLPQDATSAMAQTLSTTQAVVAGAQAGATYACLGGGTAVFTATGGTPASLLNGQLDAGERYSLQFNACRGSSGAASISGAMTVSVTAASASGVTIDTQTQAIVVMLPQRTLTLNGSSTLAQTVVASGATVTTTNHWTSPQIALTSLRNGVPSSLTLTNLDLTRSVTTSGGVATGSTHDGTVTIAATLLGDAWTATVATQGAVSFDASGTPTQGRWAITLPHNLIGLQVGAGTATLTIDNGPDGSIDHTYTFGAGALAAQAV